MAPSDTSDGGEETVDPSLTGSTSDIADASNADDTSDTSDTSATDHSPVVDGRQSRWITHNRARRVRILDAAIDLAEDRPPGAELRLEDIAERAGLRRSAVYRYFPDRDALHAAIEVEVARRAAGAILPSLDPRDDIISIIRTSIRAYVDWSLEHPSLRHIVDLGIGASDGPVTRGVSDIAQVITQLVLAAVDGFEVEADEVERSTIDPLVHGLVEAVAGGVRRWLRMEDRPPAGLFVHLASESVWYIMAGHAEALGVTLTRDLKLTDLPLGMD